MIPMGRPMRLRMRPARVFNDQTFKTDANGEIFIENLRVGKYTVTEVEDSVSAGYKRPDPVTVELVVDETLTVNVHNGKITVDVPKTGDNSHVWIWFGLMALSMAGVGTSLFVGRKKRKKISKWLYSCTQGKRKSCVQHIK